MKLNIEMGKYFCPVFWVFVLFTIRCSRSLDYIDNHKIILEDEVEIDFENCQAPFYDEDYHLDDECHRNQVQRYYVVIFNFQSLT